MIEPKEKLNRFKRERKKERRIVAHGFLSLLVSNMLTKHAFIVLGLITTSVLPESQCQ